MIKIAHAVCDENGKAYGGELGDQTSKEIRVAEFYDKPWDFYLEPLNSDMADKAATFAEKIAYSEHYGYNQHDRWSGYDVIKEHGLDVGRGDFDCSSFVLSCYMLAGLNMSKSGYTGNMHRILTSSGFFKLHDESDYLKGKTSHRGGIWVKMNSHTVMCIDGKKEDTPSSNLIRVKGSVRVRKEPNKDSETIKILRDVVIPYTGVDEATGWYIIEDGYITNNKRYVERVGE